MDVKENQSDLADGATPRARFICSGRGLTKACRKPRGPKVGQSVLIEADVAAAAFTDEEAQGHRSRVLVVRARVVLREVERREVLGTLSGVHGRSQTKGSASGSSAILNCPTRREGRDRIVKAPQNPVTAPLVLRGAGKFRTVQDQLIRLRSTPGQASAELAPGSAPPQNLMPSRRISSSQTEIP